MIYWTVFLNDDAFFHVDHTDSEEGKKSREAMNLKARQIYESVAI
jgi:hypothetical protein